MARLEELRLMREKEEEEAQKANEERLRLQKI